MALPRLSKPDVPVYNEDLWLELKELSNANQIFTALEIKTFYAIGLIDDICQCVQTLLKSDNAWPEKYLPAFGLFASIVDLLGRCLTGNRTLDVNENLRVGFWYLFNPTPTPPSRSITTVQTRTAIHQMSPAGGLYTIGNFISLRNYSLHGQATTDHLPRVHNDLLAIFPRKIGDAIEIYWSALQNNDEYCERMGAALIDPHSNRADPLFKTIDYFDQGLAAGDLFYKFDWNV